MSNGGDVRRRGTFTARRRIAERTAQVHFLNVSKERFVGHAPPRIMAQNKKGITQRFRIVVLALPAVACSDGSEDVMHNAACAGRTGISPSR